jgi:hypothetical protein
VTHTITYLIHKVTCSFEYIDCNSYSGYYWITTSEVPYYPCPLKSKTLEELTTEVKSVIDRWIKN